MNECADFLTKTTSKNVLCRDLIYSLDIIHTHTNTELEIDYVHLFILVYMLHCLICFFITLQVTDDFFPGGQCKIPELEFEPPPSAIKNLILL